jgi:hypothetical protein
VCVCFFYAVLHHVRIRDLRFRGPPRARRWRLFLGLYFRLLRQIEVLRGDKIVCVGFCSFRVFRVSFLALGLFGF